MFPTFEPDKGPLEKNWVTESHYVDNQVIIYLLMRYKKEMMSVIEELKQETLIINHIHVCTKRCFESRTGTCLS